MNDNVIQKYLNTDLHSGSISINKEYIANYIDMIRIMPDTTRILTLLCAYASRNNKVITDIKSITKLLGIREEKKVKASLHNLISNGWISIDTIKLKYAKDIVGVMHDRDLYKATNRFEWKSIGEKFITNFKLNGEFNIFTINDSMIKCEETTNSGSNLILALKNNLFYDKSISEEDVEITVSFDTNSQYGVR